MESPAEPRIFRAARRSRSRLRQYEAETRVHGRDSPVRRRRGSSPRWPHTASGVTSTRVSSALTSPRRTGTDAGGVGAVTGPITRHDAEPHRGRASAQGRHRAPTIATPSASGVPAVTAGAGGFRSPKLWPVRATDVTVARHRHSSYSLRSAVGGVPRRTLATRVSSASGPGPPSTRAVRQAR